MSRQSVGEAKSIAESKENPNVLVELSIEELTDKICKTLDQIHKTTTTDGQPALEKLKVHLIQLMSSYSELPKTLVPFKKLYEDVLDKEFVSCIKSEDKLSAEVREFKNQLSTKYKPILPFAELLTKSEWKPFAHSLVPYLNAEYFLESPENRYKTIYNLLENQDKVSGFKVALATNKRLAGVFLKQSMMNKSELMLGLKTHLGQSFFNSTTIIRNGSISKTSVNNASTFKLEAKKEQSAQCKCENLGALKKILGELDKIDVPMELQSDKYKLENVKRSLLEILSDNITPANAVSKHAEIELILPDYQEILKKLFPFLNVHKFLMA